MRNLVAVAVVALLAVPSLGVITVELESGGQNLVQVAPGATVQVDIVAGAEAGLNSLAGDVTASGAGNLTSVPNSFAWVPTFKIEALPPLIVYTNGQPGINGGWIEFGSARTDALTMPDGNWVTPAVVASYSVQVSPSAALGTETVLTFTSGDYGGWPTSDDLQGTDVSVLSGLTIRVIPEPATIALLALGGLLIRRTRKA